MAKRRPRIDIRNEPTLRKGKIKHSKRVTDRIKAAGRLRGAIGRLKEDAASGFSQRFAGELRDGETVPDQTLALELAGRSVKTAIDELTKADNIYCGHAVRRKQLNDACDHVARREVYPEVVDVRGRIDFVFGKQTGKSIHLMEGKTLRKPKRLQPQLEHLVVSLRNPRKIPRPKRPGDIVDREGWLERVEPGYEKLTTMLKKLQQEELREALLRDERDFELESFDVVYSEVLDYVRSVFRLGGFGEKEVWHLLPTVQQRRLKGKARQEREARADGKRPARGSAESGDSAGSGKRGKGPVSVA